MPTSIAPQLSAPDGEVQLEQKQEFDRWRVAVDVVHRLREAGINCELGNVQNRH
jgi:hypothetical protein